MQLPTSFTLPSDQCELLVAFESTRSLSPLAKLLGRDPSAVSRQLQRLAALAPVLEKEGGKWKLTPLGQRMAEWAREAAESQRRLLQRKAPLRIAGTREFNARVLAPQLMALLGERAPDFEVTLISAEAGIEPLLLRGDADFGFDCGRPEDPSIRFRLAQEERFVAVASAAFLKRHRPREAADLLALPHLQFRRATATQLLGLKHEVPSIYAVMNDIAAVREACVAGLGWAVLPWYAVRTELASESLKRLAVAGLPGLKTDTYGVWWPRGRPGLEPWVKRATDFLRAQEL